MLKKVSSLQVVGISYPVLLIIGILVGLIGLLVSYNQQGRNEEGIIAVIIGVLFVIAYFFTKRHECVIVSDGGSRIAFRTEGMNTETLIDMMDKIELAKTTRVSHLKTL